MAKITINKLFLMSSMKKQRNKKKITLKERQKKPLDKITTTHSFKRKLYYLTSRECLVIQNKIVGKSTITTMNISKQMSFYSKPLLLSETKIKNCEL